MAAYRLNASNIEEPLKPPKQRIRAPIVLAITVAIHAGVLVAAFMLRAPEPARDQTETVRVMRGQVDPMSGELMVIGMADARIRR